MEKLEIKDVSKSFDGKMIIENISLTVRKGELVSLLGISGSGKTTIFNIVSGLIMPDCGSVFLDGEEITGKTGKVSYMMQKDLLLPFRTIEDNVSLPLIIKGENKKDAKKRASDMFAQFGLEGTQKKYPAQLSGGMKQRAALLRTYLFSRDMALLDEPFSALDTLTKASVHKWYLDVMEKIKLSTFFITHDIDEAILISDRIYILSGQPGKITDEIVISRPKPRTEDFCLSAEFLEYKKRILKSL